MILFGTGGIRGIMKKGEFDEELVKKAASAVADWMNEDNLHTLVIAYDTRRNSMKFARICAETASKKGIRTYVFSDPVPTPLLSFAIRYMNADAGIVITASHNPPEYNGFKVYTKDGVQAIPEYTQRIASLMNTTVPSGNSFGDISPVPDEVEQVYTSKVVQLIEPFVNGTKKIVYSPLHGTGARFVKKVLDSLNMNVITVEEQFHPDTAFSTVETPNPEDESAGTRKVPFSRELYIEKTDFMENPPKKFYRLSLGREVRLRYAYFIKCVDIVKDKDGNILELHCTYDPSTKGGDAADGRKVRATLHWVSAKHAISAEVRLYSHLFKSKNPLKVEEYNDFKEDFNANSLQVVKDCKLEPSLTTAKPGNIYQFERLGYFCVDPDTTDKKIIFNRKRIFCWWKICTMERIIYY